MPENSNAQRHCRRANVDDALAGDDQGQADAGQEPEVLIDLVGCGMEQRAVRSFRSNGELLLPCQAQQPRHAVFTRLIRHAIAMLDQPLKSSEAIVL
jgi:hypothetical protein